MGFQNFEFLVKNEAERALNFLNRRGVLSAYEETILKGLRKCAKADSEANRKKRLGRLGDQLNLLVEKPEYKYKDNYFSFSKWIAAHILDKPLIEVYRSDPDRFS